MSGRGFIQEEKPQQFADYVAFQAADYAALRAELAEEKEKCKAFAEGQRYQCARAERAEALLRELCWVDREDGDGYVGLTKHEETFSDAVPLDYWQRVNAHLASPAPESPRVDDSGGISQSSCDPESPPGAHDFMRLRINAQHPPQPGPAEGGAS